MAPPQIKVITVPQHDPRLGRQLVHDERSRGWAFRPKIDQTTWRDRLIRIYDPIPNPNQDIGCCTCCSKSSQQNAVGNRVLGQVLNYDFARNTMYPLVTSIDPFPGTWPPDDTGSSGLASAKAAQKLGIGGEYRWIFGGVEEIVQTVVQGGIVSMGTWWYNDMFNPDSKGYVTPTGGRAGGHQWIFDGFDLDSRSLRGRCWWGSFKWFWLTMDTTDFLLGDGGDAHVQKRLAPVAA